MDEKQKPKRRNPKQGDFYKRLRKARKGNREVQGEDAKPKPFNFVPYGTMFKLEEPPRPGNEAGVAGRALECINCGGSLEWRIYTIAPDKFDAECPMCHVKARNFWKGKLHKELDLDVQEEES